MQPDTAMTITSPRRPPREALAQLERVVIEGDLAFLTDGERVAYYARVCESLGLNPLTRPFEYIRLNQKLTLYARKDATDQLRKINGVSVERLERERDADLELAIVTAYGRDRHGRTDSSIGAVSLKGLAGEGMANALMKAETKAKRRLTLSLAGLGWLDEIETDTALVTPVTVDPVTGAIEHEPTDAKRDGIVDRITQRTAAIRGEPIDQERGETVEAEGGATSNVSSSSRSGDPWMRRLHALGTERGMDHDALHDWAVNHFQVESLKDLDTPQRVTFIELVERLPVMEQPAGEPKSPGRTGGGGGSSDLPVADTPSLGEPVPDAATGSADVPPDSPTPVPSVDPDGLLDDILNVTGGELIPPKPRTPEFAALPSEEKLAARVYWQEHAA